MTVPGAAPAAEAQDAVPDSYGRDTPRGTVEGFLSAIAADDEERAGRYLEAGDPASFQARRAVRNLRMALDRMGVIDPTAELSNQPAGHTDDAMAQGVDMVGRVGSGDGATDLLVHRIERRGRMVWLFHADTLAALPDAVQSTSRGLIERWMPAALHDLQWRGAPLSDWLALPVVAAVALLCGTLVAFPLAWAVGRLSHLWSRGASGIDAKGTAVDARARFLLHARHPLAIMLAVAWFRTLGVALSLAITVRARADFVGDLIFLAATAWLLFLVVDAITRNVRARASRRSLATVTSVLSLASKITKVGIVVVAAFITLDTFGFDVTTGLAALGIGGLAIALGAQKTVENLVGSVTLVADQPIRIGEFCKFGDVVGTVEDIGIRSTKVRTLDQTVVTIPNGTFSSMQIENYTRRTSYLFRHQLSVPYGTPPETIRGLTRAIVAYLEAHPRVREDGGTRANFHALAADNLTVDCFATVWGPEYPDFLATQQELLLAVMEIFAEHEVEFAFPTQMVMLDRV